MFWYKNCILIVSKKSNIMKQLYIFSLFFLISFSGISQLLMPQGETYNQSPNWGIFQKSSTDSCGVYFNNYIGLAKTTSIRIENMRVGNVIESGHYSGRAQRFSAPQPIEVSGIEFYSYILNNPSVDSLMVITTLNNYDVGGNTLGAELARDTVYVSHNSFNPLTDPLPGIAVQSNFTTPITVTADYMITISTPTDDSLKIIANDPNSFDGNGEGLGYALYDNINYPSFYGWYDMVIDFTADYDFLISPKIKYSQYDTLIVSDTSICPANNLVCLTYGQSPIALLRQYNSFYNNPFNSISIDWGDGNSVDDTIAECHSYNVSTNQILTLKDTIKIWNYGASICAIEIAKNISIIDSIGIDFSYTQSGNDVTFTTTATGVDSVWWDFGDVSLGTDNLNPTHTYPGPGTYNVWLYSFNDCMTKALFKTVTIELNSIDNATKNLESIYFYPNPADSKIKLSEFNKNVKVKIVNIIGKTVYYDNNFNTDNIIDVTFLTNGTYFVSVETEEKMITKKLLIKH